ncbi:ES1 protein like protein [Sesbania bispinosa]|nr:ES1 protein like protein [Sesbania bispinosa]
MHDCSPIYKACEVKAGDITSGSDQKDNGKWPGTINAVAIQAISGQLGAIATM